MKIPESAAVLAVSAALLSAASASPSGPDNAGIARCPYRPTHSMPLAMTWQDYPLLSVAMNEQGTVLLNFLIQRDGSITDVKVEKSSSSARLDGAAVDAARERWRFDPVVEGGKPIACRYYVMVSWRLSWTEEQLAEAGITTIRLGPSDFPSGSLARNESGQSLVLAMVNAEGKISEAFPSQTSGFSDLDAAAVERVKSSNFQIVPAKISDKPVTTMLAFVVIWSPK